jgi:hypothetical protein
MNPQCPQCYGLGYVRNEYNTTALHVTCPTCNGMGIVKPIVTHNPLVGLYRHVWVKYAVKINFGKRLYWFYTNDSSTIKPVVRLFIGKNYGFHQYNGELVNANEIQLLPELDNNILNILKDSLDANVPFWQYKIAMGSKRPIYTAQILALKNQGYKRERILPDKTEIYKTTYINARSQREIVFYKYLTPDGKCGDINNNGQIPVTP